MTSLGTAAAGPVILGRRAFAQSLPARVDATALRQRIDALSKFGRPSGGGFADGVSRIAYSDADLAGRRYVIDLMRAAGLEPRVDPAGNIFGRRAAPTGPCRRSCLARTSILGVVEGIVGIDRYEATVTGFANHAGSTAMADRQDALLAASHLTIAVREVVSAEPGRQVGTVGRLEVTPNVPNVIPGVVRLTIELRDLSTEKLERLAELIRRRATEIGIETRTSIALTLTNSTGPANAAVDAQQAIERVAGRLGLRSRRLPSGAVHDAQMMAQLSPMGMIFVPSIGGSATRRAN